ncbi:MAG: PAS domain S-box protein, partial [Verrucomicrobiaceae bacterium]
MSRPLGQLSDEQLVSARFAAIIQSSFDAIVAKDLNSIITDWNPAAERLFGYSAAEAIGQPITMLIPEGMKDEESEIIGRIRNNERVESYETVRIRKDGTRIDVSLTVSPIHGPDGRVVGASKIARDITASKESERRIRVLLREINHRVKNQYAVILSLIQQTALHSEDMADFQKKVRDRIEALSTSHDLLVKTDWAGSTMAELVTQQLLPFAHREVTVNGPLLAVSPNAVQNLGMAFHELATNSAKYGVLSGRGGGIEVRWQIMPGAEGDQEFKLSWSEHFDPPLPDAPRARHGFGSVVLTDHLSELVPHQLQEVVICTKDDAIKRKLDQS